MHRLPIRELTMLPIHPIEHSVLERVGDALRERGVDVHLERPILRPRGSYDSRRQQLRAELLLECVALREERPLLGITDADCYAGELSFVFGMAEVGRGVAIVSLYRLRQRATMRSFVARAIKGIFHEMWRLAHASLRMQHRSTLSSVS